MFSTALQTQITRSLEVRAQSQADPHHGMREPKALVRPGPADLRAQVGGGLEFSMNDSRTRNKNLGRGARDNHLRRPQLWRKRSQQSLPALSPRIFHRNTIVIVKWRTIQNAPEGKSHHILTLHIKLNTAQLPAPLSRPAQSRVLSLLTGRAARLAVIAAIPSRQSSVHGT